MIKHSKIGRFILISVQIGLLFLCGLAYGASINGAYQNTGDTNVLFEVHIGRPAPSSLIIQHYHPPWASVVSVAPQPVKINNKKGFVKWFLKNPTPGKYSFSLLTSQPVPVEQLQLILRYKNPSSGKFEEVFVQP